MIFFSIGKNKHGNFYKPSSAEANKILLHRFVAAGSAVRYHAVHHKYVENVIALDVALRRDEDDWFETLPDEIDSQFVPDG